MSKVPLLVLVVVLLVGQATAVNDVLVKNLKIYVNCEEFFIKAFCYSPTPLGRSMDPNGQGGLCSWRIDAFGANSSACADEDFFDGSAGGNPAVLNDGWFKSMWARDMPVMKEMGANTIRIYHVSPWTKAYSQANIGVDGVTQPYGKSHIEFMDMAAANDLKVVFPLPGEYDWLMNYSEDKMYQLIRNVVDEVGNHSALLMWAIGNELPLDDNLIGIINKYANYARYYTYQKWNRFIPVTHCVVDNPPSYNHLAEYLAVDVFSSNAGYRGLGFQDLWTGNPAVGFAGFRNLSLTYNKPLFISEVGWMSANNEINSAIPDWFNQKLADLFNYVDDGCVGYAFFEFSDEATKADPLQQTMGVIGYNVTVVGNQNSGQANVYVADSLYKKAIIYDAVMSGTFNGKNFNMLADTFTLIGRAASVLTPDQCVAVAPTPTTSTVVTTGTPTTGSTTGAAPTTGSNPPATTSTVTTITTGSTPVTSTSGSTPVTTGSAPVTTGSAPATTESTKPATTTGSQPATTTGSSPVTTASAPATTESTKPATTTGTPDSTGYVPSSTTGEDASKVPESSASVVSSSILLVLFGLVYLL